MVLIGGQLRLVFPALGQLLLTLDVRHLPEDQAMPQVVRQHQIPREAVGERLIKVQHFQQLVALDGVQVAIGERTHVGRRLADRRVLPELVPKHITLALGRVLD